MFSKCFSFLRSHWSWSCQRASSGVIVHAAFSRRESSVDIPARRQRESYRGGEGGRFGSAPTLPHICAWKTASVPGSDSQAATASDRRLETYVEEKSPWRSTETSGNLFPKKTTSWLVSESQTASAIHWWRLCNLQQKNLKFVTFHDAGWVSISNTTFYKSNRMIRNIFLRHFLE